MGQLLPDRGPSALTGHSHTFIGRPGRGKTQFLVHWLLGSLEELGFRDS